MEKIGQLGYKGIIVLTISALIIGMFVHAGSSYGSGQAYYGLAISKDIALTIDLMYSLPGDVKYIYPNDVSAYDFMIKDNHVNVYSHSFGKFDTVVGIYRYAGIENDKLNVEIRGEKYILMEKIKDKIKITGINDKGAIFK